MDAVTPTSVRAVAEEMVARGSWVYIRSFAPNSQYSFVRVYVRFTNTKGDWKMIACNDYDHADRVLACLRDDLLRPLVAEGAWSP